MIEFEDFAKVDLRLGQVTKVEKLSNPKYTTHKLTVDFGDEVGVKVSGARVINYSDDALISKQVIGVVNMKPRQIGTLMSEVLLLGVPDDNKECILLVPDQQAVIGKKVY